jgi:hypothetical protein
MCSICKKEMPSCDLALVKKNGKAFYACPECRESSKNE